MNNPDRTPLRDFPSATSRSGLAAAVASVSLGALILSGCSTATGEDQADTQTGHYPVTVNSCDDEITFDKAPERLMLLKSASVPALHGLGVLDRAVARAGAYPEAYYDEQTLSELEEIPQLTANMDPSGHLSISRDTVIAQQPDLVLGQVDNLNQQSLSPMGISNIEEPALCPGGLQDPAFDDIYEQLQVYGEIFDRSDRAEVMISDLQERVVTARQIAQDSEHDTRTAAVLYPTVGGGTNYAYGARSMAQPQLEAAGLKNVFDNVDSRVFEVSTEELIGRNPDVIILLHSEGDPEPVKEALEMLPGAGSLSAVREDEIMVQLMNFTEPATPLSVTGLENIVERFHR